MPIPFISQLNKIAGGNGDGTTGGPTTNTYQMPNGGGAYSADNGGNVLSPADISRVQGIFKATPTVAAPVVPQAPQSNAVTSTAGAPVVPGSTGDTGGSTGTPDYSQMYNSSAPNNYIKQYMDLAIERALHSGAGTGLYAVDPSVPYNAQQIMAQRAAADDIYKNALENYGYNAQIQAYNMKNGLGGSLSNLNPASGQAVAKMATDYVNESNTVLQPVMTAANKAAITTNQIKDAIANGRPVPALNDYALIEQFAISQNPKSTVKKTIFDAVNSYAASHPGTIGMELSKWISPFQNEGSVQGNLSPAAELQLMNIIGENNNAQMDSFNKNVRENYVSRARSLGASEDAVNQFFPVQNNNAAPASGATGATGSSTTMGNTSFYKDANGNWQYK